MKMIADAIVETNSKKIIIKQYKTIDDEVVGTQFYQKITG